jgi:hypothetical protein
MPLTGTVVVAALLVGNVLNASVGGSPPLHAAAADYAAGLNGADVRNWYLGTCMVVAAYLALPVLVTYLASTLAADRHPQLRGLALVGAATTTAVALVGALPQVALMVLAVDQELTPNNAKELVLVNAASWALSWCTTALWIGPIALLMLRRPGILKVLGSAGLLVAATLPLAAATVWVSDTAVLAWMFTLLWILLVSIVLAATPTRTLPPTGAHNSTMASVRNSPVRTV